jgi:MFS family permease
VSWQDETTDPGNPKNWVMRRKRKALFGMSLFVFVSLFAVSLVATTLPAISSDLQIEQPILQEMALSIFLLGFAFGPLVASPLSEIYGRMRVIQTWNILYTICNTVCGLSRSKESIITLRFVSGVFASATLGVSRAVMTAKVHADIYRLVVALLATCFDPRSAVRVSLYTVGAR